MIPVTFSLPRDLTATLMRAAHATLDRFLTVPIKPAMPGEELPVSALFPSQPDYAGEEIAMEGGITIDCRRERPCV